MLRKAGIIALKVTLVMVALFAILTLSVYLGAFGRLHSKGELVNFKNATASTVLSGKGELIGKYFSENRTNISYDQIPPHLINALIATEDARFFEHKGVDSKSVLRVLLKTILFLDRSSGGGSTITQQLAKNMFGRRDFWILTVPVSKIKEVLLAFRLEKIFDKEEIVTLYLNTVSFGENIYGIGTASQRYFNKSVDKLNIEESAVLVGMLKANTRYNPRLHPENAESRRNVVLNQMEKYEYLTRSQTDSLCRLKLVLNYTNPESDGPADYFLFQVKNETERILGEIYLMTGKKWDLENDGLVITTTLDLVLQNYARRSFQDHLSVMQKRLNEQFRTSAGKRTISEITEKELKRLGLTGRSDEVTFQEIFDWEGSTVDSISVADSLKHSLTILHAGLLAMDPNTGAVKSWVGGIDFKSQPYDQVLARRQLASIFKPVLYAAALEEGMEPCQYLDNDSIVLAGLEDYSPENYDHSYGGKYSVAGALAQSMNVPTFSLYLKIGFPRLDSMWKAMGFSFTLDDTPSLALGTAEASIKEIAVAYSAFVNGGFLVSPQTLLSIKDPAGTEIWKNDFSAVRTRVLSERSAILMSAMLQKAIREGTGVSMSGTYGVNLPLAGKTGTSQNYADAWFAAFNPGLTIVSRVGASTPLVHFNNGSYGSGSALALPLVAMTLKRVQQNRELAEELFTSFPPLPPELEGMLDCPDFREENFFDRFKDLFEKEKDFDRQRTKPREDIRSFLRRLFRRR
jgi:penicillin-binding protein 1A